MAVSSKLVGERRTEHSLSSFLQGCVYQENPEEIN